MKINPDDVAALKKLVEQAIQNALPQTLKQNLHIKIDNSMLIHEPLMPNGDKFKFHVEVTVYPKKEKAPE